VNYEGQAAIELEMAADKDMGEAYSFWVNQEQIPMEIDLSETIKEIVYDLEKKVLASNISGKFHRTISRLITETCKIIRTKEGLNRVVLSGGVFQNMLLLSLTTKGLKESGFEVYTHHLVPTNDGGISLGQAVVAHKRLFPCA